MKPIISVQDLGKKYVLRHEGKSPYKSLRDEIFQLPRRLLTRKQEREEFWALKDVSFDIMPGDRVGIIGRNGAGKSTLLKLLSRITEPSAGRIIMRGRVASLLEVGTGFHPELSGRENIYLNGAILGMTRNEVKQKFDEIVDFAGVERFLDTPVKRYSSGMYVRLAFAVAAHLEPEILVVDEVLAVGDAEFQKKCLGKMAEVSRGEGRTVLFVSHNMAAVQQLCGRGMLLKAGCLIEDADSVGKIIALYTHPENMDGTYWVNDGTQLQNAEVIPLSIYIKDGDGNAVSSAVPHDFQCYYEVLVEIMAPQIFFDIYYCIYDKDNRLIYTNNFRETASVSSAEMGKGKWLLRTPLPRDILNEGSYRIEYVSSLCGQKWIVEPGMGPVLEWTLTYQNRNNPYWQHARLGIVATSLPWEIIPYV